jgi:hypothetical protein
MRLTRRLLLFCLFLLSLGTPGNAQPTPLNALSFSAGYSIPVGKFASKQFSDPEAGLAGAGYFTQLGYERRFRSWLGVRLSASLNSNTTNPQTMIDQYSVFLPNRDTYTWTTDVTRWRLGSVLAGPVLYARLGALTLKGHAQAGLVLAESPGLRVQGTSSTGQYPVDARVSKSDARAFGVGAGGSVRFPLYKRLLFQLTGDWVASRIQLYDVPTYTQVGDNAPINGLLSPRRLVGVLNTGAGLVVEF